MKAPRHHACLDVMQSERMLRSGCMCTARVLATVRKGEIATAGVPRTGACHDASNQRRPMRCHRGDAVCGVTDFGTYLAGEWCRRAVGAPVGETYR